MRDVNPASHWLASGAFALVGDPILQLELNRTARSLSGAEIRVLNARLGT